jgi:uncharacterized protein YqfA (UPF0365 family)
MLLAQAEREKAQADMAQAQVKASQIQAEAAIKMQKVQLEAQELDLKAREQELRIMEMQIKQGLEVDTHRFNQMVKRVEMANQALNDETDRFNKDADSLNKMKSATGADAIISPSVAAAYEGLATDMASEV